MKISTKNSPKALLHLLSVLRRNDENEEEDEKEDSKTSGMDPFLSKMLKTRTILLSGEIKKELSERTIRQLL
jgi:ATP-dependent Clp protease protease subunit